MQIQVKNVGEAKTLMQANGIRVQQSKYTNGNSGYIIVSDPQSSTAIFLLRSYGMCK